jgi:beta-lactamase superfamily II metal-dependent hydrolase
MSHVDVPRPTIESVGAPPPDRIPDGLARCYFLDVGQGSSQVIALGRGRAIVIDGGPSAYVPIRLLNRYANEAIVALIVTHNDSDHHHGALQILNQYRGKIGTLYLLQDRPIDHIGLLRVADELWDQGKLDVCRLELRPKRSRDGQTTSDDDIGRILFRERDLELELLYPTFIDNARAQQQGDPNATSAVLALHAGKRRILFPGDATIAAWRSIRKRLGAPIPCDVLAVPHHGGLIGSEKRSDPDSLPDDLRWLYSEAVRCRLAIISAGTGNPYDHPREDVIRAIGESSTPRPPVLCTEITNRCCDLARLVTARDGILPLPDSAFSRSGWSRAQGDRRHVACGGTIVAHVGSDEIIVERLAEHQAGIDEIQATGLGKPLCRRWAKPKVLAPT